MPELPEVETTVKGLSVILNQKISNVKIHTSKLRFKIPNNTINILRNSKISNLRRIAKFIIKSKILPLLGEIIAKDKNAYEYLSESIDLFPSQEELSKNLRDCGFKKVETINLFNGIVAIHTGYKI